MNRPKQCPNCKSTKVLIIVYGLVNPFTLKEDEFPGGCIVSDNDANWHCQNCDWEWGPKTTGQFNKSEED